MRELQLGDDLDDYCTKCKRLTNHAVVSIVNGEAAKVRCRSCYGDHDYRKEQIPPSKKDLKKAAMFNEVLAGASGSPAAEMPPDAAIEAATEAAPAAKPAKKRGKAS